VIELVEITEPGGLDHRSGGVLLSSVIELVEITVR
jgi:hypothetical protein